MGFGTGKKFNQARRLCAALSYVALANLDRVAVYGVSDEPIAEVVRLFGGQGSLNVNSWSPDNRTIAFASYRLKQ